MITENNGGQLLFIYLFVRLFVCSFVCSFVYFFILFIYLFILFIYFKRNVVFKRGVITENNSAVRWLRVWLYELGLPKRYQKKRIKEKC